MKKVILLTMSLSLVYFMSCNQAEKGKSENTRAIYEVGDQLDGKSLTACFHSSKIYWKGSKPGGEHNGLIKLKSGGNFIVDDDKLLGGEFIIDMSTIVDIDLEDEAMNAKLVGHLKSVDFFNVDSFPEAKFVIAQVLPVSNGDIYNSEIKGNLTIKGITQPISFKAKVGVVEGMVTAMSEEFEIDRTLFGVNFQSKSIFKELTDKFINDKFLIKIEAYSM